MLKEYESLILNNSCIPLFAFLTKDEFEPLLITHETGSI